MKRKKRVIACVELVVYERAASLSPADLSDALVYECGRARRMLMKDIVRYSRRSTRWKGSRV